MLNHNFRTDKVEIEKYFYLFLSKQLSDGRFLYIITDTRPFALLVWSQSPVRRVCSNVNNNNKYVNKTNLEARGTINVLQTGSLAATNAPKD